MWPGQDKRQDKAGATGELSVVRGATRVGRVGVMLSRGNENGRVWSGGSRLAVGNVPWVGHSRQSVGLEIGFFLRMILGQWLHVLTR